MTVDLDALRERLRLEASPERLRQLHDRVRTSLEGLNEADRYAFLLVTEREILGPRGHPTTLKFGSSVYDNSPAPTSGGGAGVSVPPDGRDVR